LFVLQGGDGAPPAGPKQPQVLAGLPRAEGDPLGPQGVGQLGSRPGPLGAQQPIEHATDLLAAGGVLGRPGLAPAQGRNPIGREALERLPDRGRMAVQIPADARRAPAVGRQQDHLDPVPLGRPQRPIVAERLDGAPLFGSEREADHTSTFSTSWARCLGSRGQCTS